MTRWRATASARCARHPPRQRQRQIDAAVTPAEVQIFAVAHEDRVRLHPDGGIAPGELGTVQPVRRRAPAFEQAGRREQEGAGADRSARRARRACARTQPSSAGSAAAAWTPGPPATSSVSSAALAPRQRAATSPSPAEAVTTGAAADTTRGA